MLFSPPGIGAPMPLSSTTPGGIAKCKGVLLRLPESIGSPVSGLLELPVDD